MTEQQTLTIQEAIDLGVEHHNAGRLPEAENIYNQILKKLLKNGKLILIISYSV